MSHEQFHLSARLSKQKMWRRRLLWWNIKKEDNPNWRTRWQRQKVAHISTFKQDQTSTCKRRKFQDPCNELPRPSETKVMRSSFYSRSQASSEYSERKLLAKTVCVIWRPSKSHCIVNFINTLTTDVSLVDNVLKIPDEISAEKWKIKYFSYCYS